MAVAPPRRVYRGGRVLRHLGLPHHWTSRPPIGVNGTNISAVLLVGPCQKASARCLHCPVSRRGRDVPVCADHPMAAVPVRDDRLCGLRRELAAVGQLRRLHGVNESCLSGPEFLDAQRGGAVLHRGAPAPDCRHADSYLVPPHHPYVRHCPGHHRQLWLGCAPDTGRTTPCLSLNPHAGLGVRGWCAHQLHRVESFRRQSATGHHGGCCAHRYLCIHHGWCGLPGNRSTRPCYGYCTLHRCQLRQRLVVGQGWNVVVGGLPWRDFLQPVPVALAADRPGAIHDWHRDLRLDGHIGAARGMCLCHPFVPSD